MVAYAILACVCEVGMGRAEYRAHIVVVVGVLVGIAHDKPNRAAGRLAFKHSAEKLYLVGFVACCGYLALSGTSAVEFALYELHVDVHSCRHSIHYASYGRSVALAERCQREKVSKCISHN